jgi:hypothetical protein
MCFNFLISFSNPLCVIIIAVFVKFIQIQTGVFNISYATQLVIKLVAVWPRVVSSRRPTSLSVRGAQGSFTNSTHLPPWSTHNHYTPPLILASVYAGSKPFPPLFWPRCQHHHHLPGHSNVVMGIRVVWWSGQNLKQFSEGIALNRVKNELFFMMFRNMLDYIWWGG